MSHMVRGDMIHREQGAQGAGSEMAGHAEKACQRAGSEEMVRQWVVAGGRERGRACGEEREYLRELVRWSPGARHWGWRRGVGDLNQQGVWRRLS